MRISNSFSEGEIQVLEFILQTLLRGGSPSMATRNKNFASVYRKVMSMKARVEEKERQQQATVKSSVGTIAAESDEEADEQQAAG
ncbi:MAG: hypothetical protein GXP55_08955 [Deltaproteobacteria bacterium]|nr:hypothetical protein [Deltaproteobacteria bacterium]